MVNRDSLAAFKADDVGVANGNYFGFPFSLEECDLVLQSVEWDATVSYGAGTSEAPCAIIDASTQVEIYDQQFGEVWQRGIGTLDAVQFAEHNNKEIREVASRIIENAESGGENLSQEELNELLNRVNDAGRALNDAVYEQAKGELEKGKLVGLVGGDHSTPLGLIKAVAERGDIGILHIDAHCDLRDAYEGFEFSHASIMRNALKLEGVKKLVQVAVRDFSKEEMAFAKSDNRIVQFSDLMISEMRFGERTWSEVCSEIADQLPKNIYVSFDIDGLQQQFCPSTGTPVPGGISYNEAIYLLYVLHKKGKSIVGFDLTEVANGLCGEWDANVGARVLYKLCNLALASNR